MALKGMSTSIVIVVAAIVILISALVVMGVFTGGVGIFSNFFNPWAQQTISVASCKARCSTLCSIDSSKSPPDGYDQECTAAGFPCSCQSNCVASGEACTPLIDKCCDSSQTCQTVDGNTVCR
jgi:hypothetical protein